MIVKVDISADRLDETIRRARRVKISVLHLSGPGGGNPGCSVQGTQVAVKNWLANNGYSRDEYVVLNHEGGF